jgi:PAS domain S-box-containing protein
LQNEDINYQVLFDSMPMPRFLLEADGKGNYVFTQANKSALKYFNRDSQQLEGESVTSILDEGNTKQFLNSLEVAFKQKQSVTFQALPGLPGEMRIGSFIISPVQDEQSDIKYFDVIAVPGVASDDSSIQRERDDAISLLTSVFDVSEVGIIVIDRKRRMVRVNDSFLSGWGREDLIGHDFINLMTADEKEIAEKRHDEFIKSGIRSSGEMKLMRKDGSIANALYTTATIELSHGRRFLVTTIMDITLRKRMETSLRLAKEQADAANKAKSTFLANMSHELRTPLNAIIGFSEMMIKETFGPVGSAKYKEYQQDIVLSARHLLDVINEVLDMSKIEAGRVELMEERFDLKEVVNAVLRMMASRAFSAGLKLEKVIQDDLPIIYADPRLIKQIIINLVGNAVKYTGSGGTVEIFVHIDADGNLVIKVKDNGSGIPADKIDVALEPFGQVTDNVGNDRYQGTGLGLPLAQSMAELHGGTLSLESEVGIGTTATLTLPAYRTKENAGQSQSPLARLQKKSTVVSSEE